MSEHEEILAAWNNGAVVSGRAWDGSRGPFPAAPGPCGAAAGTRRTDTAFLSPPHPAAPSRPPSPLSGPSGCSWSPRRHDRGMRPWERRWDRVWVQQWKASPPQTEDASHVSKEQSKPPQSGSTLLLRLFGGNLGESCITCLLM